jgi:hypothetical protein
VAADLLSRARELERRDAEIAHDLDVLADIAERAGATRTRASEVQSALDGLPSERAELTRRADAAQAEALAARGALASAEARIATLARGRRRKQDELDRAEREARTAAQRVLDAESGVGRLADQLEELRASEPRLRVEGAALVREAAVIAGELARLPRTPAAEGLEPGETLAALEQWGLLVRSAVLVARGTLEAERERIVTEANALAAGVLGEPLGASSVALVRRRLEQLA